MPKHPDHDVFSIPEITRWLDESQYIRAMDLIGEAASLAGDGQGGELGLNPEYERGMAELIVRYMNWDSFNIPEVIEAIHNTARDRITR